MKKLSEIVTYFNQGRTGTGTDRCLCSVLVRYMGNDNWEAHLMNVFHRVSKEALDVAVVGSGDTGKKAVSSLIELLTKNDVYRLPARAKSGESEVPGLRLKQLTQAVENDVYNEERAAAVQRLHKHAKRK